MLQLKWYSFVCCIVLLTLCIFYEPAITTTTLPLVGWLKFLNWIELKNFVLCVSGIVQRKASSVKRTSKPRYLTLSCPAVCRGQTGARTVSHCRTLCELRQSRTHCFYTLDQVFRMKRCPPVYSPLKFRHGISVLFWSFFARPNDMHIINYFRANH